MFLSLSSESTQIRLDWKFKGGKKYSPHFIIQVEIKKTHIINSKFKLTYARAFSLEKINH